MSGGRPTKLDAKMAERICACLRDGMTLEATADVCGINRDTLREYMRGEHEFSGALKRAEGDAERTLVQRIRDASTESGEDRTQWQAAAWILERRFRDRWGRHEKVTLDGKVASVVLPREEQARLARKFLAELDAEGDDE